MLHQYKFDSQGVVLDTCSGAVHLVDDVAYDIIALWPDRSLKGKIRTILIPGRLRRKLLKWARAQKIASGELFVTRTGRSLSRAQIWAEMKNLCSHAGVDPVKVFPHNLRHLFARAFYRVSRDVSRLADVLGHSSIETTRIYLLTTSAEHERTLEKLGLVL